MVDISFFHIDAVETSGRLHVGVVVSIGAGFEIITAGLLNGVLFTGDLTRLSFLEGSVL